MRLNRKTTLLFLVAGFWCSLGTSLRGETWRWKSEPGTSLALCREDAVVWQFNYAQQEPKPFFHPVATPSGIVLSCDRPPDHAWHHGLWFCWKYINGINYWEPAQGSDLPAGRTKWEDVEIAVKEDGSANISLDLTYAPADKPAVLTEKRVIAVSPPDRKGTYYFDWMCRFTAGNEDLQLDRTPLEDEPGGQPWGGYAGLSVRLSQSLSDRGAATTDGPVEFNAQSRFRGRALAMDYHGAVQNSQVGMAICDHPDNLNHPSPWYAIRTPVMSYFSPAVICYGPASLSAGQSMTLKYRVLVHAGHWGADRLREEHDRFVRSP
jgi:hypothetical protein